MDLGGRDRGARVCHGNLIQAGNHVTGGIKPRHIRSLMGVNDECVGALGGVGARAEFARER